MNDAQAEVELTRDNAPTPFEEAIRQRWPSVVKAETNPVTGRSMLTAAGIGILASDLVRQPLLYTATWAGTGAALSIASPFIPDAVIIMGDGKYPVFSHRFSWRKRTPYLALATAHVTSGVTFSDTGITLGTDAAVNASGVSYSAIFIADNGSGKLVCGSFSGNGAAGREIDNVGGQPVFVLAKRDNTYPSQLRFECSAQGLQGTAVTPTDNITGFTSNGFTVSSAADINAAVTAAGSGGEAYDYLAFLPCAAWKCFSYAASGTAGQRVALPWAAAAALIKSTDSATPQSMAVMIGGAAKNADAGALLSDCVTAVTSSGLTLGTNAIVNAAGKVYNGVAFASNVTAQSLDTKVVPSGLLVTAAASSGVVCATVNTGFDRAALPFSLELYVDIDQTLATDQYLFTRSLNSSNITYGLYWNAANSQFEFVGHESAANKSIFSTAAQKSGPLHLILTFDGTSKFRFAVDGKTVKVMDTAFTLDTVASSLMTFGCRANSGAPAATGCAAGAKLYMARFYIAALTDAQILQRYKRCALNDHSVLDVAYYEEWDFSRVIGSTAYASKSATNNGTITACTQI